MSSAIEDFIRSSEQYKYITFSDPATCRTKLQNLYDAGLPSLHVIADFDMTLTQHWITPEGRGEAVRNLSSHAVLERGPHVSKSFAAHTKALADRYYPHEIDPALDQVRKVELMIEWWSAAHKAMIKERLTRKQIHDQAVYANMTWRAGILQFIDELHEREVPLLVFSAGIADVIEELLNVSDLSRSNQFVVSNHMIFSFSQQHDETGAKANGSVEDHVGRSFALKPGDSTSIEDKTGLNGNTNGTGPADDNIEDVLIGFAEPLIHTFNKGEQALYKSSALGSIKDTLMQRKSVILMGDSIGDAKMADGVDHAEKLSIGFCNFGGAERRKEFLDTFDVVIEGDASLEWVTSLLQWLARTK